MKTLQATICAWPMSQVVWREETLVHTTGREMIHMTQRPCHMTMVFGEVKIYVVTSTAIATFSQNWLRQV